MTTNKAIAALTREAQASLKKAEEHLIHGNNEKAIKVYDEAIASEPSGYIFAKRGHAKFQYGDYEGAIRDFDFAISQKPDSPVTLRFRAKAKECLGQLDDAIADYKLSILISNRSISHSDMAMILHYQGQLTEAYAEYNLAAEMDPENEDAKRGKSELELRLNALSHT